MKIVCTKEEFIEIVNACDPGMDECNGCVLEGVCDSKKQLMEKCDIQEEPYEQQE